MSEQIAYAQTVAAARWAAYEEKRKPEEDVGSVEENRSREYAGALSDQKREHGGSLRH